MVFKATVGIVGLLTEGDTRIYKKIKRDLEREKNKKDIEAVSGSIQPDKPDNAPVKPGVFTEVHMPSGGILPSQPPKLSPQLSGSDVRQAEIDRLVAADAADGHSIPLINGQLRRARLREQGWTDPEIDKLEEFEIDQILLGIIPESMRMQLRTLGRDDNTITLSEARQILNDEEDMVF